ncbi:hypothetical protein [Bradyrhizobium sp. Leo170]|nr:MULTISPECIES: hypothetical protein [unclassified Bradyrhizobium]
MGRSHARAMLVEAAWSAAKAPVHCMCFFVMPVLAAADDPSDRL